jgi:cell division protein ZapA (FtsZ GTPase activity inhibitor)
VTQKRTVPVTIQGRQYRIRADGDAGSVERAAELLDETMTKVRTRSGTADSVDIAVLAALNLANALAADRAGEAMSRDLEERIDALVRLVETATAEPGAAAS